jgi:hypothetical protein
MDCMSTRSVVRECVLMSPIQFGKSLTLDTLIPTPTRLLRYCARPPSAMARLRKEDAALAYRCAKQHSESGSDTRGAKVDELHLTPLELIERIAALVPPPRRNRRRYFGVLAPNSPLRTAGGSSITSVSTRCSLTLRPIHATQCKTRA